MGNMLSEALDYANRGWYVFPCREKPGAPYTKRGETITPTEKQPYVASGLYAATLDEDQIREWWARFPDALIGVNAGMSGLFVVDIDKKHVDGLETFASWNINDSAGLHSITPSGGMHILFTGSGKSTANAKTGVDTRGEGGYFIVPPSKILEGEYTGEYKRFDDWARTPGVIPDGLMGKLFPDNTLEYVRGNNSMFSGDKRQLSRASLNFLANGAEKGERNSTLFKVLADFCGCGYTEEESREAVLPVCLRIELDKSEFEVVLSHAYSKERTASIPDSIQEKIISGDKKIASKITFEEQAIIENVLIACLLIENSLIPIVNDILNFEDFSVFRNRFVYKAINRLYNSGLKVDYLTVSSEVLKETEQISIDDISKLVNQCYVNIDNAESYASIIKEKASIRKIESLMDNKEHYIKKGNLIEIVNDIEKDISDIALYGGAKSTNVLTSKQATEMVAERTRMLAEGKIEQLKTGFSDYDYQIGGLYTNELVICAARSGEGKSSLALSVINQVSIVQRKATAFFALEMSTHETICRLVCQLTGIPFKDVYQGKMSDKEWVLYREAMEKISDSNIYFDDSFGITIAELRSKIRKLMEKDIKLVVIDQLEQIKGYVNQPVYIQYDKIAIDVKAFTKEFGIPIILNHQLNRNITDRKIKNPEIQLSDLNQAGEKPADQVWAIAHKKDERGKILKSKIKILKNRNGAQIEFAVVFVGERMLFSNPTREEEKHAFHYTDNTDHDDHDSQGDGDEPNWAN